MATKHQRETHPTYVDGCFACKVSSLQIAPSVAESTESGAHVKAAVNWDKQNEKDVAAYLRLVASGVQPAHVGGSDRWEKSGATDYEMVSGQHFDLQYGAEMAHTMRRDLPHAIQDIPDVYEAVQAQPLPLEDSA